MNYDQVSTLAAGSATLLLLISLVFLRPHLGQIRARSAQIRQDRRPKRHVVLRVREVPDSKSIEDLIHDLRTISTIDPALREAVDTIDRISLIPTHKPWACATASFHTELLDTELAERLTSASAAASLAYRCDCTFSGITPIHEDKAGAQVDILAVPGLGSHAVGSWKMAGGSDIWLRDYLAELSGIRVLLYGYDTGLLKSDSRKSIEDMGRMLLESITAFRTETQSKRPIILIGHSLGGLLIKEALIHASKHRRHTLSQTCCGLLFFGVPNLGLRNEQLLSLVRGQPNESLVRDLLVDQDTEPSAFLRRVSSHFAESCKGRYPVISFYELRRSPTVERQIDGTLTKSGTKVFMVTEKSATSTGITAVADEDNVGLDADHSSLVKFDSRSCDSYLKVKGRISFLIAGIPKLKQTSGDSLEPEAMLAWNNMNIPPYSSFRNSAKLSEPVEGTLQWLLQPPTTEHSDPLHLQSRDFLSWRDSPESQCLLLTGPPGQGKSVLSNFIIANLEESRLPYSKIIYYFCSIRDNDVSSPNASSVLRSLVVQLCEDQQQLFDMIPSEMTRRTSFLQAPVDTLLYAFGKMLKSNVYTTVYCVIDGLDVYSEGMSELTTELVRLFSTFNEDQKSAIKLLCTSRPYTRISKAWGQSPRKELHCEAKDLEAFIRSKVGSLEPDYTPEMRNMITARLSEKAGRTFLWVDIVIRRVQAMSFPSTALIDAEIAKSSSDLNDLYTSLIHALGSNKRHATILVWVALAKRPLLCAELAEAISVDLDEEATSFQRCLERKPQVTPDQLHRSLGTLLDVIDGKVYLMHQSVKDFLEEADALKEIFCSIRTPLIPAYVTTTYLQLEDMPLSTLQENSFFRYCAQYWFTHINSAADIHENDRLRRMIARIIDPKAEKTQVWLKYSARHIPAYIDYPSDIALAFDIGWLAQLLLDRKFDDVDCQFKEDCLSKAFLKEGKALKALLQHEAREDLILTQQIAAGIMGKFEAEMTKTLLQMRGQNLQLTSAMVRAAAANWISGGEIMELLLRRWDKEIQITPAVLQVAAANFFEGLNIIRILVSKRGHEIQITPRVLAAAAGNWQGGQEIIRLLFRTNDQLQITSEVLQAAAQNAFEGLDILMLLLQRGENKIHITPNVVTAATGNWRNGDELVQLLLQHNQSAVQVTKEMLVAAARNEAVTKQTLRYLLTSIKDINTFDKDGWTPISAAASKGRLDVVKLLFENKADVAAPNKDGSTPVHVAAGNGYLNIVQFLFKNNADIAVANKDGRTPAHNAAEGGRLDVVRFLFDNKANITVADKRGRTPMIAAAANGHLHVVEFLFENKVDIAAASKDGRTPVHFAALNGHLDMAKFLFENGADITAASKDGSTPMNAAAGNGHLNVVKFLFENKAGITVATKDGRTPVYCAALGGHLDVIKFLFKSKADITIGSKNGAAFLNAAASNGHLDVIKFLVDHGADVTIPDKYGSTPLYMAALRGYFDIVKFLFDKNASITVANNGGWTPLHAAASDGHPEKAGMSRRIADNSLEVNSREQSLQDTTTNGQIELLRLLIENEVSIISGRDDVSTSHSDATRRDHRNLQSIEVFGDGKTTSNDLISGYKPVVVAGFLLRNEGENLIRIKYDHLRHTKTKVGGSMNIFRLIINDATNAGPISSDKRASTFTQKGSGHFHTMTFLCARQADIRARNKEGYTPGHSAAAGGNIDIVKFLFGNGADIKAATKDGRTPVYLAALNGHLDVVKFLFDNGADIKTATKDGATPVGGAALNGHLDVVKFLFDNGADIKTTTKDGVIPVYFAALNGHLDVVKFLFDNGADIKATTKDGATPVY
ncbi:hypothetical protein JX266_013987, partial [Neoarthrinium moseri]